MLRCILIPLVFYACFLAGQQTVAGRYRELPPGQLRLGDSSEWYGTQLTSRSYIDRHYAFPEQVPVSIARRNVYFPKHVQQVNVYDTNGKPVYEFAFNAAGQISAGMINLDNRIRWREYETDENVKVRVECHYDRQDRLARLDSTVQVYHSNEPADTVVTYTTVKHWTYLSGTAINERNMYYNSAYYGKRAAFRAASSRTKTQRKGHIYLKRLLPVNFRPDSLYLDRYTECDEDFRVLVYNESGKEDLCKQLPENHGLKKRCRPAALNRYATAGADFNEPGGLTDSTIQTGQQFQKAKIGRTKRASEKYLCTLTRRRLIDSIFSKPSSSFGDSLLSLRYTVKYQYRWDAYFSGNEYEPEPQLVLREQENRFGRDYWQANFNRTYQVPSDKFVWLGDVSAYVKQRVKAIHVYYQGREELQAFELDNSGKLVGGMDPHGARRWKDYTDEAGNRVSINAYYDYNGWLQKKDSAVYKIKTLSFSDTSLTFQRMQSFTYQKGKLINERNRKYNEKYLNQRVRSNGGLSAYRSADPEDPRGPEEGYIYLKSALKTDYADDLLYLSITAVGDYGWKITRSGIDITDSIPVKHRLWRQLIRPEIVKKHVSGEDFDPPYEEPWGPICGGSGYGGHYAPPDERSIFLSYSWTFNEKGLYDTCYQAIRESPSPGGQEQDDEAGGQAPKKSPSKYVLYTVRYEYY